MFGLGIHELIIVGVVAVLLFGRKLPEVAKSMGASYREFRKGLTDIHTSMDVSDYGSSSNSYSSSSSYEHDDYDDPSAPKFDPPPSEPQESAADPSGAEEKNDAEAV